MSNTINLKDKIMYHYKGEETEASFVTILKPTAKHISLVSVLKQAFQVAAMSINDGKDKEEKDDKDDKDDDSVISPSDAVALVYAGGKNISIKEVMLTAKELLTSGLVLVEGEEKLTKPLCDKLSQDDFEEILGSFLVNFIVKSLLTGRKKK